MGEVEDSLLARQWIDRQRVREEGNLDALEAIDGLRRTDPERCWAVILQIFDRARADDAMLSNLAAGPLEDLLADHGERFIARVETLARQEPRFRFTTQMVWRNSIALAVWARLRKAANLDP
jgi:hypothetical protein